MGQTCRRTAAWAHLTALLPLALAVSFSVLHPADAADDAPEREQLSIIVRQLDLIDRLTEHAVNVAPQTHTRYHFDYARLRADLKRIRAGMQDYLIPQRAQPSDPVPLTGDYVRRDDREESSP